MQHTFKQWSKKLFSLFLIAGLLSVESCSRAPLTGRRQLNLVPSSQVMALSFEQYQEVMKQSKLSNNREWTNMVKTVGRDISRAVEEYMREEGEYEEIENFKWEFNLLAEEVINAWAMPGGKIAFYEGIMPICENETGVAVVMGHEIAHAVAEHGQERMSLQLAQQLGGMSLALALSQKPELTQQLAMTAFGLGAQVGVLLPYSREHESEADRIGLIFMAKAGYDPRVAPEFWQRMQGADQNQRPPEFLSTHPHPDTRIRKLNQYMDEAMEVYRNSR